MGADPEPWVLIPNHLHLVSFVAGGELARIALARVLGNMARANGLDRAASNIARAAQPDADVELATEMVSLATAKTANDANVALARTAYETMGTLVGLIA